MLWSRKHMQLQGTIAAFQTTAQKAVNSFVLQATLRIWIRAETKGVDAGRNVAFTDQNTNTGIEHN